jgi:YHS domain-containing protein
MFHPHRRPRGHHASIARQDPVLEREQARQAVQGVAHARGSRIAIADRYHVEGDKIAAIRTILDTGPFTAPVGGEAAVDPVRGMPVSKASAAATRTFDGVTYYLCSTDCAEAFDRERSSTITASALSRSRDSRPPP